MAFKGHIPWDKGKKRPEMIGNKFGFKKGQTPWNKGKEYIAIRGKKNPRWKGGINLENERIRHSLEWKIWRDEVYRKDNWTCRICGKKCKKDIVAHHIKLFSNFPELRFSVDNGITLCRSCHTKIHKQKINEN